MRFHVADVTLVAGVLLAAPGMAGMCWTVLWGQSLHELPVEMVALGLVLAIAGLAPRFVQHHDGGTNQTEALLRVRHQSQRAAAASADHEPAGTAGAQPAYVAPGSWAPIPR